APRKPKPMKKTESKCDGQAKPAARSFGPEDILHCHKHDAGGDHRLDDALAERNPVQHRKRECDRVRQREGGDDFYQVPQFARGKYQRGGEEEVIEPGLAPIPTFGADRADDVAYAMHGIFTECLAELNMSRRRGDGLTGGGCGPIATVNKSLLAGQEAGFK